MIHRGPGAAEYQPGAYPTDERETGWAENSEEVMAYYRLDR